MANLFSAGIFAKRSVHWGIEGNHTIPQPEAAAVLYHKTRIATLQSIRFFASLGVFQYHLWNNYLHVQIGHPGTDLFLVLMGVVAAHNQALRISDGKWGRYLLSRWVRLYVTFVPLTLLTLAIKRNEATWDWIWRSFLFVPIPDRSPIIGCTWMLSNFMLFYLIFSLAFMARREVFMVPVFLLWATGIIAYTWVGWQPNIPDHWANLLFAERNLDMMLGYAVGIALRKNYISIFWGRVLSWIGLFTLIGGTILLNLGYNGIARFLFIGLPIGLFLLGTAALEKYNAPNRIVRILTWPGLVWLGGVSYVLYLTNGIFLQAWSRILPVTPALVPLIVLCALVVAIGGTIFWEEPMHKRLKVWLRL